MRRLAAAALVLLAFASLAEARKLKGDYAYQAVGADTTETCRTIAREQVRRRLLGELGAELAGHSVFKDMELTGEEAAVIAGAMVRTKVLDGRLDGGTCSISMKMAADPGRIARTARELLEQGEALAELEMVREQTDEALGKIMRLQEELAGREGDRELAGRYASAVEELACARMLAEGQALSISGKQKEALRAFEQAVKRAPSPKAAYLARGFVLVRAGDSRGAVKDFDAALKLDPQSAVAWLGRGMAFKKAGMEKLALRDLGKAIRFQPDLAPAYYQRAEALRFLGNKDALMDLQRAAELGHKKARRVFNKLKQQGVW
jgi:tetratricopeptide (TPR) repeat protein